MNYLKVVEECKKLTDMATFATFDSFKVIHEEMRKTGGTIFNIFNPVGISGDNLQEFDKIVDNIWLNKDKSTYYLSRNTVKNYCLGCVGKIEQTKKHKQFSDKISLKVEECLCQTYFIT